MTPRDTATLEALAEPIIGSPRRQPYRPIHKAIRHLLCRGLQQLGCLDVSRPEDLAAAIRLVDELLQVCSDHLAHENRHFHRALRARAPRAVLPFDDDHRSHEDAMAELRGRLQALQQGGAAVRGAGHGLYLALSRFVGENLEHMADEETQLTQALWQHFSDAEIAALEAELQASLGDTERLFYLRWLARSLNDSELGELASVVRQQLPMPAFRGWVAVVGAELDAPRRARLLQPLDLAVL